MKQELLNQLREFASEDLFLTRKQGDLIIVESKLGRVMIVHNPKPESEFDILGQEFGGYSEPLHRGNFVETRDYIATNLYIVE